MVKRLRVKGKSYANKRDNAGRLAIETQEAWLKAYKQQQRLWEKLGRIEKLVTKYTKLADNEHAFNEGLEKTKIGVVNEALEWNK